MTSLNSWKSILNTLIIRGSLVSLMTLSTWGQVERANAQANEPIYLRYQGTIEGVSGDLSGTIGCYFELTDANSSILWDDQIDNVVVIERHFTVTLGTNIEGGLSPEWFQDQVNLNVTCEVGGDQVSTQEIVSMTPRAAYSKRSLHAETASAVVRDGVSLIGDRGAWVGDVESEGKVTASRVESGAVSLESLYLSDPLAAEEDEPRVLIDQSGTWRGSVESLIGRITNLYSETSQLGQAEITSLYLHSDELDTPPSLLIDETGTWLGSVYYQDSDEDGVSDLFETLFGTDPEDALSRPEDRDEDGVIDVLQSPDTDQITSQVEGFSSVFTGQRTTENFNTDPQTPEAWDAGSIELSESGILQALTVVIGLQHPVDLNQLKVKLRGPTGEEVLLFDGGANPEDPLGNEATLTFNEDQPPEGINWYLDVLTAQGEPRELTGVWTVVLEDQFGAGLSSALTAFSLEFTYLSDTQLSISRELIMGDGQRIRGLVAPEEATEAAPKGYVDQQISTLREETNTAIQAIHPSYPQRFTYRARTFETYDVGNLTYYFNDQASLFGGVPPSAWSTLGATAGQINPALLDALLSEEGQGGLDAFISQKSFTQAQSQEGLFIVLHTQVENTTEADIDWTIQFEFTCNEQGFSGPQRSSFALNGIDVWSTQGDLCGSSSQTKSLDLSLPAETLSDLVFVISASDLDTSAVRRLLFAFTGGSLLLPDGLQYRKTW